MKATLCVLFALAALLAAAKAQGQHDRPRDLLAQQQQEITDAQIQPFTSMAGSVVMSLDKLAQCTAVLQKLATSQEASTAVLQKLAMSQEASTAVLQKLATSQEASTAKLQKLAASQEASTGLLQKLAASQEASTAVLQKLATSREASTGLLQKLVASQEEPFWKVGHCAVSPQLAFFSGKQRAEFGAGWGHPLAGRVAWET
jgi:uncharacterized protein (DUF849 family)